MGATKIITFFFFFFYKLNNILRKSKHISYYRFFLRGCNQKRFISYVALNQNDEMI